MQGRIVAFFLPVFAVAAVALGLVLALESASTISFRAESARRAELVTLIEDVRSAADPSDAVGRLERSNDQFDRELLLATPNGLDEPLLRRARSVSPEPVLATESRVLPWTTGRWELSAVLPEPLAEWRLTVVTDADEVAREVQRRWVLIGAAVITGLVVIAAGAYPLAHRPRPGARVGSRGTGDRGR
ncbi:MAG: hypothetical protein R2705_01655 [Ilumatobacteraceae bacterium]